MACSFNGPNAEKQANDLALELRQRVSHGGLRPRKANSSWMIPTATC